LPIALVGAAASSHPIGYQCTRKNGDTQNICPTTYIARCDELIEGRVGALLISRLSPNPGHNIRPMEIVNIYLGREQCRRVLPQIVRIPVSHSRHEHVDDLHTTAMTNPTKGANIRKVCTQKLSASLQILFDFVVLPAA
jgi:hypothetical protein